MLTMSRRRVLAAAAGGLASSMATPVRAAEQSKFPADFVWGASTASYQIEGAVKQDGRGDSIWDVFCRTPGRVKNGDTGDVACDHYHRWREDVELLANGGFGAYRFSTAWPRILPAGVGAIEHRGLDFYDRLVDALLERRITPWLCLYHWDLPQRLQEQGGWLSRDICQKFADYARIVVQRLGDRVKHWATFNEPNVHALFGHGVGTHAPGLTGLHNMLAASHHQNLAHGYAVQALRAERSDLRVGTIINQQPARPCSDADADRRAAARFDAMWNGACLDPLLTGRYPEPLVAALAPLIAVGDLAAMRQLLDYLGVNYYSPMYITHAPGSLLDAWFGALPHGSPVTAMGWPIDAAALTAELIRLRDRYGDLEFYLTENGACFDDKAAADGAVQDNARIAYLRDHLAAAHRAIAAGVKLRGYFVWSLIDNFEWAEGFGRRFGVVRVDYATQKRTPKASFAYLAAVARGAS